MQLGLAILLCAAFICVAESRRLFRFREIFPPRTIFQQRAIEPTPPVSPESRPEVNGDGSHVTPRPGMTPGYDVPSGPVVPADESEADWPFAMMEFSALVGRCITAQYMMKMTPRKPSRGILVDACPGVFKAAKLYAEADEETREKAEKYTEEVFHLLQCVNLQAERENIKVLTDMASPKITRGHNPDNYFEEAKELFNVCERVFNDAEGYLEDWETRFDKEMASYEGSLEYMLRKFARSGPRKG